jgi:hypothetical protein
MKFLSANFAQEDVDLFLRKLSIFVLVTFLAGFATGCNILGSSDDNDDDAYVAPSANVKLSVPVSIPAAVSSSSIRAQSTLVEIDGRRLVSGATVTVNGIVLTEDPQKAGYYFGEFTREAIENGFVVEAKKGKLKMVNVVTAKEVQNKAQIEAPVDEVSTAFAEVAKVSAGMNNYEDLIVRNDELEIDIDELKDNVAVESAFDTVKEKIKEAFEKVTETDLDDDAEGDMLEDAATEIKDEISKIDDSIIPQRSDEDILKARAQRFINIFVAVQSGKSLTDADKEFIKNRVSDDFVLNGTTKTMILSELGISSSLRRNQANMRALINFIQDELQLKKISDTAYLAGAKGTLVFTGGITEPLDAMTYGFDYNTDFGSYSAPRLSSEDIFPVMLKKIDGNWLIVGNGVKVEDLCIRLNKQYFADSEEEKTAFWFQVDEADTFAVNSITITGPQISGALELEKNPMSPKDWYYMVQDGEFKHTSGYPKDSWTDITHQAGDTYKFTISYSDSTIQEFSFKVPTHSDIPYLKNIEIDLDNANNTAAVSWAQTELTDFESYHVAVYGSIYQEREFIDKTLTSLDLSLAGIQPLETIQIVVETMTLRGVAQQYLLNLQIPEVQEVDQTLQMVQSLINGVNVGARTVADTTANIPVPFSQSFAASIRASGTDVSGYGFPTGTQFYETFNIEGDEETLNNIFSMPTEDYVGMNYLLARFFDADGNLVDYPFTDIPSKMNIGALVDHEIANARARLDIFYGDEETGGALVAPEESISFKVSGDIEVTVDDATYVFEIDEEESSCSVNGGIPSGTLAGAFVKDGNYQIVDNKSIVISEAVFNNNGLVSGTIMVDDQEYASISVEDGSVVINIIDNEEN